MSTLSYIQKHQFLLNNLYENPRLFEFPRIESFVEIWKHWQSIVQNTLELICVHSENQHVAENLPEILKHVLFHNFLLH